MKPGLILAFGLAAILAVGCHSVREPASFSTPPVSRTQICPITRADAERIVLAQFEDATKVRVVSANLDDGVWRLLVARLPLTPGAHTVFMVRARDGVIIETSPGA